ncbi:MAG: YihA family ribosome biogenesis GTP-binding protein [Firmicutes bacterium]|nr:YihA family ribosome biogenesis GTP-binding protein [Bacillota bacterium]
MRVIKAELECVAAKKSQYPEPDLPEIAFVGRSNVGKSSLLNLITGRKSLARVSGNPGKTRTINFYRINDSFRIVDLPGYGYAKAAKTVTKDWGRMMEEYFETRPNLRTVVQLVDCRHEPSAQDRQMFEYLKFFELDRIVVLTKADKISRSELAKNTAMIKRSLELDGHHCIIPVSALKRTGDDLLLNEIERVLEEE